MVHRSVLAEPHGQLDPQLLTVQSVGGLVGSPLLIVGKLPSRSAGELKLTAEIKIDQFHNKLVREAFRKALSDSDAMLLFCLLHTCEIEVEAGVLNESARSVAAALLRTTLARWLRAFTVESGAMITERGRVTGIGYGMEIGAAMLMQTI